MRNQGRNKREKHDKKRGIKKEAREGRRKKEKEINEKGRRRKRGI